MATLVVMAAGLGSRYGGSKQLEGVGPAGELLLEYAAFDARRSGFTRAVFILRRDLEEPFAPLAERMAKSIEVDTVIQDPADLPSWFAPPERTRPWGTVHAVLAARHAVDGPFAVLNADDFYGAAAFDLARAACDSAARDGAYATIGLPLEATLSPHGPVVRGICETRGGWLTRLEEVRGIERSSDGVRGEFRSGPRTLTGREAASMNFWVFTPEVFPQLADRFNTFLRESGTDPTSELLLPDAIGELVAAYTARVRVHEAPGPWFGLTYLDDWRKVTAGLLELVRAGVYPPSLWGGR